ncbi:MAG: hypothetical protein E6K91_01450 [Thaumarchaeota archaeon]|nr:MAG: hypothetical protein E6K91_01450 [Nitrososphaerota archaeon]
MSAANESKDSSMPVVKGKDPHNYRKVGYSMIVISVSLVLIGLLVWAIGDNYHFASNIMAAQEVDAMTPKQGYDIVSFDYTQPVGAKLKLLDYASSIDDAKKLQDKYMQNAEASQILIFGNAPDQNVDVMAQAEVTALTPIGGYNVILFNHALPVGSKLTMGKHDDSLVNATKYKQDQEEQNKDKDVSVIIFSSSYGDNLKIVGVNQTAGTTTSATGINSDQLAVNANVNNGTSKTVSLSEKIEINASNSGK